MEYLLRLANERYNLLAQWPDFSTMFGKDYYYRCAHRMEGMEGSQLKVAVAQVRCLSCLKGYGARLPKA
jgi:hypothetical protein